MKSKTRYGIFVHSIAFFFSCYFFSLKNTFGKEIFNPKIHFTKYSSGKQKPDVCLVNLVNFFN